MKLIYPINFVGHEEWMNSGYAFDLAGGDVITRYGEVLGAWRVVDYDPEAEDEGGRYEFVVDGQDVVMFAEEFAFLDYRSSVTLRGGPSYWAETFCLGPSLCPTIDTDPK